MTATVEKAPGDPWPAARAGLEILLLPGIHQPAELGGAPDMTIRAADDGVVIRGSIRPGGGEDPCALRIHDGADRLSIIGPLVIDGSEGRGLRVTAARGLILRDILSCHHGIEAIILGNCPGALLDEITVSDSEPSPYTTADRRHGLYLSGDMSWTVLSGLAAARVTGSGLQVNGAGLGEIVRELACEEMTFDNCGSGGTPPISLMAVRDSIFERFYVADCPGDRWAVLFDDYQGPEFACYGNMFLGYTVPAGTRPAEEGGSSRNLFFPRGGWGPESPPEPPVEALPPSALEDLDIIEAALATIDGQIALAQAALSIITEQTIIAQEAQARLEAVLSPAT